MTGDIKCECLESGGGFPHGVTGKEGTSGSRAHLSRLLAGRLEFGLLAHLLHLLVLGEAVGVLGAR